MAWDDLMSRPYDERAWNCAHFAAEVWRRETGEEIVDLLTPATRPGGRIPRVLGSLFERSAQAPRLALAVLRRKRERPHLGILVRGRLVHLRPTGVESMAPEIAVLGYDSVTYYVRRGT